MKTYELNFNGREVRALGAFGDFTLCVMADSIEAAWLRAYDTHEHITRKHWRVVPTARQIARTKNLLRCL